MTQQNITVKQAEDWGTLQQLLYQDTDDDVSHYRSSEVFRGHSNREYTLTSSLQRFVGDSGQWDLELKLLRDFNKYAQQYMDEPESFFHLRTSAQHYGIPTRLIDWTYSPLVATYFATGGDPNIDGEVLVVDYAAAHQQLPPIFKEVLTHANTDMFNVDLAVAVVDRLLQEAGVDVSTVRVRTGEMELIEILEASVDLRDRYPDPYVVSIDDVTDELMACMCPHHILRNAVCKHMAAVENTADDDTLNVFLSENDKSTSAPREL